MAEGSNGGSEFKEVWMVLGIFLLIFVIWVVTGGPSKPIASGGFFLTSPRPISTGETTRTGADLDYTAPHIFPGVRGRDREPSDNESSPALSNARSPYVGIISLSQNDRATGENDSDEEYVRITNQSGTSIALSGWTLISEVTGASATIPQGTEIPYSRSTSPREGITLNSGDIAYVVSGRSPIGTSFRINSCTGYFEQYQDFEPRLPIKCPSAEDELDDFSNIHSSSCEDFVEDISRCELVTHIPSSVSNSCEGFVEENIRYEGCVENHEYDRDFLSDEWRIYLGKNNDLWKSSRDTIKLLDTQGRVVDQISY